MPYGELVEGLSAKKDAREGQQERPQKHDCRCCTHPIGCDGQVTGEGEQAQQPSVHRIFDSGGGTEDKQSVAAQRSGHIASTVGGRRDAEMLVPNLDRRRRVVVKSTDQN